MSNSIIPQEPVPVKPLSLTALTDLASQDLYALGLTDAHIAALDAAHWTTCVPRLTDAWERRQLEGAIARATDRANGVTLADVAAVLGYTPAEGQG